MAADEWDAAFDERAGDEVDVDVDGTRPGATGAKDQPEPVYPTVEAWVVEFLAPTIRRRPTRSGVWCPQWWRHAEAVSRLEALWRAWEFLRLDGTTGMSVWWRDHLNPHLADLIDQDRSPFAQCTANGHVGEEDPLPVELAPADWWGDDPTDSSDGNDSSSAPSS